MILRSGNTPDNQNIADLICSLANWGFKGVCTIPSQTVFFYIKKAVRNFVVTFLVLGVECRDFAQINVTYPTSDIRSENVDAVNISVDAKVTTVPALFFSSCKKRFRNFIVTFLVFGVECRDFAQINVTYPTSDIRSENVDDVNISVDARVPITPGRQR